MSNYGIAVDVGTSSITLSLNDITLRKRIDTRTFCNPQHTYGDDVITRISHELNMPSVVSPLRTMLRQSIKTQIRNTLEKHHVSVSDVLRVVAVGNTVMHHFLFGYPLESLVVEPYAAVNTDELRIPANQIGLALPNAICYSPPLVGSYVGSDALCVVLWSHMIDDSTPSLALDIGTNSEILLQKEGRVWIASAASGPAFEGMALEWGVPAIPGAITRVIANVEERSFSFETIENASPTGFCGVGVISALHALRSLGIIDSKGSIDRDSVPEKIDLVGGVVRVLFTDQAIFDAQLPIHMDQMEIRILQQSKASIRAVIEILLKEAGCTPEEVENLYITGAFGNGLDIEDAYGVGLFPYFPNIIETRQQVGGALIGAELLLFDETLQDQMSDFAKSIIYVEMMDHPEYRETHARHLFFP